MTQPISLAALAIMTATFIFSALPYSAEAQSFDQYGNPLKSTRELCEDAQRAGGPITEKCARDAYLNGYTAGLGAPTQYGKDKCAGSKRTGVNANANCSLAEQQSRPVDDEPTDAEKRATVDRAIAAILVRKTEYTVWAKANGYTGNETVIFNFDKWGYAHKEKMPLWQAAWMDMPAPMFDRDGYLRANAKNWRKVPAAVRLDYWQRWFMDEQTCQVFLQTGDLTNCD